MGDVWVCKQIQGRQCRLKWVEKCVRNLIAITFLKSCPYLEGRTKDQQHLRIPFGRKGSPTLFASETMAPDRRKRKGAKWQTDTRKRESEDHCSPSAAGEQLLFPGVRETNNIF